VIEVRWHARAGQGAKTAAQLLAEAMLRAGKSVQAFPEYGPERRGAPLRAYTRIDDHPIRRHDVVTRPDLVVVLEPSLAHEAYVTEGAKDSTITLVAGDEAPPGATAVPARGSVNLVLLGAVAAALRQPLDSFEDAAVALLGSKAGEDAIRAALREGYACLS
jgi:Pyruvate/2-oxoacid:ferredoxin oxidoreductase gamma subunit